MRLSPRPRAVTSRRSHDATERRDASRAVESNASLWAALLGAVQVPGHRRVRDTYCDSGGTDPAAVLDTPAIARALPDVLSSVGKPPAPGPPQAPSAQWRRASLSAKRVTFLSRGCEVYWWKSQSLFTRGLPAVT